MSMLPIDMTITVQRAPEVARTQAGESARPEMAQDQFAEKFNREVRQQDQQINQTQKSEENAVNRDGRGNNGGGSLKKRQKEKKETKTQPNQARSNGSLFDVSI